MRSRNRKVNSIGKAGCLLLLLLAFLVINPIGSSAYAEEQTGEMGDRITYDSEIAVAADTPSTISISFSPTSGSATLSPITSAGQSAQINVLATVGVQNSGGYSVYIKSNTPNLVGENSSANIIPGINGAVTYDNLVTNTWGYSANEGAAVPENAVYKALSVTGNGDKVAENPNNKIYSDTKQVMLSFAVKIGTDIPADTYQNTITMSVVSSPLETTLTDIADMQSMTTSICEASNTYETKQLKDTRDGKYYWVSKLADGKCWMTQNLDLDLSTSKALTPADSDVSSNWMPGYTTATTADDSTVDGDYNNPGRARSWSLGNYRMKDSVAASGSDCGYPKNDASQCMDQFEVYTTPTSQNGDAKAHYILGNHYQWNAAVAGSGTGLTSGEAKSSICPKGWKLPTSNNTNVGSFGGLINAYSVGTDVAKLTSSPLYFVRGGSVHQTTGHLFFVAGANGYYWSSTLLSNDDNVYILSFADTNYIIPSRSNGRLYGFSVRCLAR